MFVTKHTRVSGYTISIMVTYYATYHSTVVTFVNTQKYEELCLPSNFRTITRAKFNAANPLHIQIYAYTRCIKFQVGRRFSNLFDILQRILDSYMHVRVQPLRSVHRLNLIMNIVPTDIYSSE